MSRGTRKIDSELVVIEEDGRLIVQTREQAIREAQAIVNRTVPADVSLVNELFIQRKRERAGDESASLVIR